MNRLPEHDLCPALIELGEYTSRISMHSGLIVMHALDLSKLIPIH
jgi:hypothetical protein